MKKALDILEKIYGYSSFRKGQEEIIESIITGHNTLAVMPTGGGKSICYQLPALMFDGLTIVISPLISLMKDQVDVLNGLGVSASFINSTLSSIEVEEVLFRIRNKDLKILYVAPERLRDMVLLDVLNSIEVSQVSVDEAHCVSHWGHDFRSSYRDISSFIARLKKRPVITGFTATASQKVRDDILAMLGIEDANVFISGFDRENIKIDILKGVDKKDYILSYIKENIDLSGIIYASTRKEVEEITKFLNKNDIKALKYHAGLPEKERSKNQEDFIYDTSNIIVATNAFGMGIDKPNVRFVIHYSIPRSIEAYYQEIGRAGRDGEKSEAILLFASSDVQTQKFLIDSSIQNSERKEAELQKLQSMLDFVYSNSCYRKYVLNYFEDEAKDNCGNCSNCLASQNEIDKTLDAQKVLSCVYRMKRPYGIGVIVDVLKGSKVKKIIDLGFNTLSTYGLMKDYNKDDLKEFVNTLVAHGYLGINVTEYPTLYVNNTSAEILKGNKKVILREISIQRNIDKENELYSMLKVRVIEIAREKNVAPYSILGDSSIKEMSIKFPCDKADFIKIQGVNEEKYNAFGESIISIIKKYKEDNDIKVDKNINSKVKKEVSSLPMYVETDKDLLNELIILRDEIATKERIYKSYVLAINTLKEISGRYPTNIEEFTDISGIGPKKIASYANVFLNLVKDYIEKNDIEVIWEEKGRKKVVLDGEVRTAKEITIDELSAGKNISEISEEVELSISTILGYVTEYILSGNEYTFDIDLKSYYDENEYQIIVDSLNKIGDENLAKVKKELPREIKYESIRAIILERILEK